MAGRQTLRSVGPHAIGSIRLMIAHNLQITMNAVLLWPTVGSPLGGSAVRRSGLRRLIEIIFSAGQTIDPGADAAQERLTACRAGSGIGGAVASPPAAAEGDDIMATKPDEAGISNRGTCRAIAGVLLAAALCGRAAIPAEAGDMQEVMPPPTHPSAPVQTAPSAPVHAAPTTHQPNLGPSSVIQRQGATNVMEAVGDTTQALVSRKERERFLTRERKRLEDKKKELEKKLADMKKGFLDSKDGKDARKKIDEEAKKRKKKIQDLIDERNMKQGANCCGYSEVLKVMDWFKAEFEKIWKEYDKAEEKIFEDEFKKKNPKGFKEYDEAKNDHKKTESEGKQVQQQLDKLKGSPETVDVQP
jgi:hypothetical protein